MNYFDVNLSKIEKTLISNNPYAILLYNSNIQNIKNANAGMRGWLSQLVKHLPLVHHGVPHWAPCSVGNLPATPCACLFSLSLTNT